MPSIRIQRLQNLIQSRIAMVLLRDLQDPRLGLVTITKIELAKDLSHAKVFWSTMQEGAQRRTTEHALKDATPYIQRAVAEILATRIAPQLHFTFDPSLERMERLSRVIGGALSEDEERQRARGELGPVPADPDDEDEASESSGTPEDDPSTAPES